MQNPNPTRGMNIDKLISIIRENVVEYTNSHLSGGEAVHDAYVVFQSKSLNDYIATMGTHAHDGRYFFCYYDGSTENVFVEVGRKSHNEAVRVPFTVLPPDMDKVFRKKICSYLRENSPDFDPHWAADIRMSFFSAGLNKKAVYVADDCSEVAFECTANGKKGEFYFDVYHLESTFTIPVPLKDLMENTKSEFPEHFNFGVALSLLKNGGKVARSGWNGKNQHIELATNISYKSPTGEIVNAEHDAIGNKAIAFVGTSGVQLGWLASQSDMLAEDWMISE